MVRELKQIQWRELWGCINSGFLQTAVWDLLNSDGSREREKRGINDIDNDTYGTDTQWDDNACIFSGYFEYKYLRCFLNVNSSQEFRIRTISLSLI